MSFLSERYYQTLENHKIYSAISTTERLKHFMEQEVLLVWLFQEYLRRFHYDLLAIPNIFASESYKVQLKSANELSLAQYCTKTESGKIYSSFEMYLDLMGSLGCNLDSIFSFFDLAEAGEDLATAISLANFSNPYRQLGLLLLQCIDAPIPFRSKLLALCLEPFIPVQFLNQLADLSNLKNSNPSPNYWSYKSKEFSGSICKNSSSALSFIEKIISSNCNELDEIVYNFMKLKINAWDHICKCVEKIEPCFTRVDSNQPVKIAHLHLVR